VPDPPPFDAIVEDAGRQRLAAYYLYSALAAGLMSPGDLASGRWPPAVAEPMRRLVLARLAPGSGRGLDAQLTPAEWGRWRSPDRAAGFARLVVDLINHGSFGPLCADADRVRLAPADGRGPDLELIQGEDVVGTCAVADHWELVAQHLAGLPLHRRPEAGTGRPGSAQWAARELEETGISHAVSATVTLAVSIHPLGAAAGLGTRLVRSRIRSGTDEAAALGDLGAELRALRAQDDRELLDETVAGSGNRRPHQARQPPTSQGHRHPGP
jgi:hypothetical protein